tara:strand:- start:88 stop:759 length:672 start_codon:yes stop_codon:yes gene_type:complete
VIVAGISVSFWLNEISIGNQNEKERIKVLNSLNMEVNEIQSYCDERVNRWNKDRRILMMFLESSGQNFNVDSISKITTSKSSIEFNLIYYRVFEPPMNRYLSIINAGTLKYVKSDKIKEILSRLHNTYLSYVETTVEYEKILKENFVSFFATNHSDIIIAGSDNKISFDEYSLMLYNSIKNDKKLKSNLIVLDDYLGSKLTFIKLYINILDELEIELNDKLNS